MIPMNRIGGSVPAGIQQPEPTDVDQIQKPSAASTATGMDPVDKMEVRTPSKFDISSLFAHPAAATATPAPIADIVDALSIFQPAGEEQIHGINQESNVQNFVGTAPEYAKQVNDFLHQGDSGPRPETPDNAFVAISSNQITYAGLAPAGAPETPAPADPPAPPAEDPPADPIDPGDPPVDEA